jgi:hypothetical protein
MMGIPLLILMSFALPLLGSCGYKFGYRHFAGPILPAPHQTPPVVPASDQALQMKVGDDRSVTFVMDRLEVGLRPITDDILNRQFPNNSAFQEGFYQNPYFSPDNPYTYGDWRPPEQDWAPNRFTIFLLRVKNYAFPKVLVDPSNVQLTATNGRNYQALSLKALVEYHWPYAVAYGGNTYARFEERKDILKSTLFRGDMIFSGQEVEGYIVFPALDRDVEAFTVWVERIVLRFDYRNEPVETIDIPYRFHREVYMARRPHPE